MIEGATKSKNYDESDLSSIWKTQGISAYYHSLLTEKRLSDKNIFSIDVSQILYLNQAINHLDIILEPFVHDRLSDISIEDIFLQEFIVILKHSLQN